MTKKDYELIAAAVRENAALTRRDDAFKAAVADVAGSLAVALASDNPRFDRARFLAACGVAL